MRIKELDYIKGVMIIFVITFHLVYFENLYPYAKQVVYTFHMPVFLVISGYLMNICKQWKVFLTTLLGLTIPYLLMESGYIMMASMLPINEHIDHLTIGVFFSKLALHPLGPYWYLHSLILCGLTYYIVFRYARVKNLTRFILMGIAFYFYSRVLTILSFASSIFFLAGVILRQSNISFTCFFQSSSVAIVALGLLAINTPYLNQATLGGILIIYLATSYCMVLYKHSHQQVLQLISFLGKNSLLLFLFSPIFTFLCKLFIPYLEFDKTGVLFLIISLMICISGSLCLGYLSDVLRLSPLLFRKKRIIQ